MNKDGNHKDISAETVPQSMSDEAKLLKDRLAIYEAAPGPCKGSLGLFLRQFYADITGGGSAA